MYQLNFWWWSFKGHTATTPQDFYPFFFFLSNLIEIEAGLPLETLSYYHHCVIKYLQAGLVIYTCMTPTATRAQAWLLEASS